MQIRYFKSRCQQTVKKLDVGTKPELCIKTCCVNPATEMRPHESNLSISKSKGRYPAYTSVSQIRSVPHTVGGKNLELGQLK